MSYNYYVDKTQKWLEASSSQRQTSPKGRDREFSRICQETSKVFDFIF